MSRLVKPLVQRRTYVETADLIVDLFFGIVYFSVFVSLIATGASLLITLVGLPILAGTAILARRAAALERWRARVCLGIRIDTPVRPSARSDGVIQKLLAPLRDRTTYKELLYVTLVQPLLSIVNFTVAVTAWFVPIYALTLPIYGFYVRPELWNGERLDAWSEIVPIAIVGLLLLPLAPWIVRAMAGADRAVAQWGLSPSRTTVVAPPDGRVQPDHDSVDPRSLVSLESRH
jgi:hypothetical protein